jgi:hypothetical protein
MKVFILWLLIHGHPTMLGLYPSMDLCQSAQKIGEAQAPQISRGRFICIPAGAKP